MVATLGRFNNEALAKFNTKAEEVKVVSKPPSVGDLQKMKGIHYTRTVKKNNG